MSYFVRPENRTNSKNTLKFRAFDETGQFIDYRQGNVIYAVILSVCKGFDNEANLFSGRFS